MAEAYGIDRTKEAYAIAICDTPLRGESGERNDEAYESFSAAC